MVENMGDIYRCEIEMVNANEIQKYYFVHMPVIERELKINTLIMALSRQMKMGVYKAVSFTEFVKAKHSHSGDS